MPLRLERLDARLAPAATLQIIHASPFAAAASVDVYVNGVRAADNLAYTKATDFLSLPGGADLTIDIVPGTATNNSSPLLTTVAKLDDGKAYVAAAAGDPAGSGAGKLGLVLFSPARSASPNGTVTDLLVLNASPDSPAIDLGVRGQPPLVSNLAPTTYAANYVTVAAGVYTLDVTPAGAAAASNAFVADLNPAGGKAGVLVLTGFAGTATANPLTLVRANADGSTTTFPPAALPARVQFIQNSPYPTAQAVDVYIDGSRVLNDFAFRTASPFLNVVPDVEHVIDIVAAAADDNSAPLRTARLTVAAGKSAVAAIVGDPLSPGVPARFELVSTVVPTAADKTRAEVLVLHGSPDGPVVDVKVRGVGTIADSLASGRFDTAGPDAVPVGAYTIDVAQADGVTRVGSFAADLTAAGGQTVVVAASGFVSPTGTNPAFGLLLVRPDGTTAVLPRARPFSLDNRYAVGGRVVTAFGSDPAQASLFTFDTKQLFNLTPFAQGSGTPVRVATGDFDNDGLADFAVGTGPGRATDVRVISGADGKTEIFRTAPFEAAFTGGVYVAAGDLNGDGVPELVVTPDEGGGPRVQVYNGLSFVRDADFFGISDPNFRGGARATVGDMNADGVGDLVVVAGFGGGPRVAGFDGKSVLPAQTGGIAGGPARIFADFFAFEQALRNGIFVAVGDIDADGFADLIAGGGPGGGPRVLALSGQALTAGGNKLSAIANFFAGEDSSRNGVRLAAKDLDGDNRADLVVGIGPGPGQQVRTFLGKAMAAGGQPPVFSEASPFNDANAPVFVG